MANAKNQEVQAELTVPAQRSIVTVAGPGADYIRPVLMSVISALLAGSVVGLLVMWSTVTMLQERVNVAAKTVEELRAGQANATVVTNLINEHRNLISTLQVKIDDLCTRVAQHDERAVDIGQLNQTVGALRERVAGIEAKAPPKQ
jgi:polyhydroxyalkanoate synthesis regulator phasin